MVWLRSILVFSLSLSQAEQFLKYEILSCKYCPYSVPGHKAYPFQPIVGTGEIVGDQAFYTHDEDL